jgi:drug/metabolite transporter (DMT)-like permease
MKKGLIAYPPAQMAALRICIAGLCLLPVAIRHLKKINRKQFFYIVLFGLTNAGLPAFLFSNAETVVSSSTAGILNSLTPIFTLLIGVIAFHQKFRWMRLVGVLTGFAGACILVFGANGNQAGPSAQNQALYAGMIVLATICYGFSSNIIKNHLQNVPGYIVSAFSYLAFAMPLSIWLLFFSDFPKRVAAHPSGISSLLYITILAVLGSAFAIILVVRLIQVSNALFGSFVTYLIPFVSIMWGILDHETVNSLSFISLILIFAGIIAAGYDKPARNKAIPAEET